MGMDSTSWVLIAIAVLIVVMGVVALWVRKNGGARKTNYKTLFIIGISWIPLGLATDNSAFWVIGMVLVGVGLVNKNKWEDEKGWQELNPKERKLKITAISFLTLLLVVGIGVYFLSR
jgi:hypothetical protein